MLSPKIVDDSDFIKKGLDQPFFIIENALLPDVAERLYEELATYTGWVREDWEKGEASFTYSRYKVEFGTGGVPPATQEFYDYLRSDTCLAWISNASGIQCHDFQGSAALLRAGDHLTVHNDQYIDDGNDEHISTRSITFNYYLTKDWKAEWGGHFIWQNPYSEVMPKFNSLVLFRVGPDSSHRVEPVAGNAGAPRMAITGWFMSSRKKQNLRSKLNLKLG